MFLIEGIFQYKRKTIFPGKHIFYDQLTYISQAFFLHNVLYIT